MSVAARASAFAALALLGVGAVYAPVPTFTAVAVIFALGLWAPSPLQVSAAPQIDPYTR